MSNDTPHTVLPLHQLIARVGDELDAMGQLSLSVQNAMTAGTRTMASDPKLMNALQGIDRISQGLADLGRLMKYVGQTAPEGVALRCADLDAQIALRDTSQRLLAKAPGDFQYSDLAVTGEVTWF